MSEPYVPSIDNPLYKPADVAKMFSVTAYTVRQWCREGKLQSIKLPNGQVRITHESMAAYANQMYGDNK